MAVVKAPAKRIDPPSRPPMDFEERMRLADRDPNKHYHWATEVGSHNRDFYESLGYEVENHTEGGVRLLMGGHSKRKREMGQPITQLGFVLMSCDLELKHQMEAGGQAIADQTERKMITRRVTQDTMRGIDLRGPHGPIMSVENETGPAVPFQV